MRSFEEAMQLRDRQFETFNVENLDYRFKDLYETQERVVVEIDGNFWRGVVELSLGPRPWFVLSTKRGATETYAALILDSRAEIKEGVDLRGHPQKPVGPMIQIAR